MATRSWTPGQDSNVATEPWMLARDEANGRQDATAAGKDQRFLRLKQDLHEQLISRLDLSAIGTMSEEELRLEVRRAAEELCRMGSDLLSLGERERLVNEVLDETFGLGPLEPLMRDPTITDIMINGPKTVYVERNGRLERANIAFNDDQHLLQIVQRIVGRVGRRVDETKPMVDARLPTAAVSTPSSRHWPSTGRWCRSGASAAGRS